MADLIEITPEMFLLANGEGNKLDAKGKENALRQMCHYLGLNPAGVPIQFITLNGKLVPYLTRGATDQIAANSGMSREVVDRSTIQGVHVVRAKAIMPDGRTDESTGAVNIEGLKGEALANALMKAETKAKRRVVLSIKGYGMMDESEIPTEGNQARPQVQAPRSMLSAPAQVVTKSEPAPVKAFDPFPADAEPAKPAPARPEQLKELVRLVKALDLNGPDLLKPYGAKVSGDLTGSQAAEIILDLQEQEKERKAIANG